MSKMWHGNNIVYLHCRNRCPLIVFYIHFVHPYCCTIYGFLMLTVYNHTNKEWTDISNFSLKTDDRTIYRNYATRL